MSKSEVIVAVGAEGGTIALYGTPTDRGWIFAREVNEGTPDLLDEAPVHTTSATVESRAAALELFDRYRCPMLHPIFVHPDFRRQIWDAVQERLRGDTPQVALRQWREVCGLD
jgi:hypothetical protein